METYLLFFLCLQLLPLPFQSVPGVLTVLPWARDGDGVEPLVRLGDSYVDVTLFHQLADLAAFLADDVAMEFIRNVNLYLDGD